jgi:hypothetical protein
MSLECELSGAVWVRSSHSDGSGGNCVEFTRTLLTAHALVPVRDSKTPQGPALLFPAKSWSSFVTAIRNPAAEA